MMHVIRPVAIGMSFIGMMFVGLAARALAGDAPLERVMTIALKGPQGKPDHMTLDARRNRILLANRPNATLDVIDVKDGKLVKEIPGQKGIQGVAYVPDLDRIFVGLGGGGDLNAFDGESCEPRKGTRFAENADNVRYDPRTGHLLVTHDDKFLSVLDPKTLTAKAQVTFAGMPEAFWIAKDRPRAYVNVPSQNEVVVVDTDKNAIVDRFAIKSAGTNYSLALDEARRRIYVGCRKAPAMVVLDLESGKELSAVAIPKDVDDLFYDARRDRVYASCGEGFLTVLRRADGDRFEVAAKMPTAKLARTCYFDAATSRLFLAVPRQDDRKGPELWVYRARP
jgi:DNA-binding beta-propeller fold protein YncE